jgi:hypothetical protein
MPQAERGLIFSMFENSVMNRILVLKREEVKDAGERCIMSSIVRTLRRILIK